MFWYKSCPKCRTGDMVSDRDLYGWFRQCIQCGYLEELIGRLALAPVPVVAVARRRTT